MYKIISCPECGHALEEHNFHEHCDKCDCKLTIPEIVNMIIKEEKESK